LRGLDHGAAASRARPEREIGRPRDACGAPVLVELHRDGARRRRPCATVQRSLQRLRSVLTRPGVMCGLDEPGCPAGETPVADTAGHEVIGELPRLEQVVVLTEVFPPG